MVWKPRTATSTHVWLSMEMEDSTPAVEQPAPKWTKTSSTRPDFTSDARFTKLVPLFGVDSAAELNDAAHFSQSDFARMVSPLKVRSTQENVKAGSIKSWTTAVEMCLQYADVPVAVEPAAADSRRC